MIEVGVLAMLLLVGFAGALVLYVWHDSKDQK
jgi:hypothetical protein